MAFNKAKVLREAENLVSQGKINQSIKRYFEIFEKEPSDLNLLNTIGDLYVRDKNVAEGLKQFYKLAEAYVQGGYTLKAIAIYKKIVKLDPDSVAPLLKLADLYQSQRLVREARDLFYQIVEQYKKKHQNDQALEVLRKVVQLDVENAVARSRLAAFCEELGRKDEAVQVYRETAHLALARGDTGSARSALKKAQELIPDDPQILLLKAREALALQHPEEVEVILSSTPGLTDDPAARSLLIESYLAMRQGERAETLVLDLFRDAPSDFSPLACLVSACVTAGEFDVATKALSAVADQIIEQGNTSPLMESLRLISSKSPQHLPTLDLILRICENGGDEKLANTLEDLGVAYTRCGQLEKAEQAYRRLLSCDPANDRYQSLVRDVLKKQGKDLGEEQSGDLAGTAGAMAQEAGAPTSAASPSRDLDREDTVREALENSELLARYNLVGKAVDELDKVLEIYPDEIEIHRRLLGMCWKDLPERAEQAAQSLAEIYRQKGDAESAKRFAQMIGGRGAPPLMPDSPQATDETSGSPAPIAEAPPEAALQQEHATSETSPAQPAASLDLSPRIQEIDLSEDWEAFLAQTATASAGAETSPEAASFNYEDSRIEVNFYLEHGFLEEAKQAVEDLEKSLPGHPRVAQLRALVEAHTGEPSGIPAPQPAEPSEPVPVEACASHEEEITGLQEAAGASTTQASASLVEETAVPQEAAETSTLEASALPEEETAVLQETAGTSAAPGEEIQPDANLLGSPPEPDFPLDAAPASSVELTALPLVEEAESFETSKEVLQEPLLEAATLSAPAGEPVVVPAEETPVEARPSVSVEAMAFPLGEPVEEMEFAVGGSEEIAAQPAPAPAPPVESAALPAEEIPSVTAPDVAVEEPTGRMGELAEALEPATPVLEDLAPELALASSPGPDAAAGHNEEVSLESAEGVNSEELASRVNELVEALGSMKAESEGASPQAVIPPAPAAEPPTEFAAIPAPASSAGWPLEEIADEPTIAGPVREDDAESHYYLGVAFWEMNLIDEAIGEFQKVVKGAGKGNYPPNFLQACTLLALCFKDKGMTPIAAKWYCRALETPDLDEEAWLTLQYDLGITYEQAGDLPRALERFSEVYGQNIHFRDVAEKIRTFQQKGP